MAGRTTDRLDSQADATNVELLTNTGWQMSLGERAALVGVLCQVAPRLAIEIGTAEGGSLVPMAAYGEEVHSFDLVKARAPERFDNVEFHTGDSHKLLPEFLKQLERAGTNVDFALVDGDHSADGVRKDIEDLLNSGAVSQTVMLMHDTMNDEVRAGLERVDYESYAKIAHVDLDFVPGFLARQDPHRHQLWGGLGLVIVDQKGGRRYGPKAKQSQYYEAFSLISEMRDVVAMGERGELGEESVAAALVRLHKGLPETTGELVTIHEELEATRGELVQVRAWLHAVEHSASWRFTSPLRRVKAVLRRRRRDV